METTNSTITSKTSARDRILLTAHDLFYREGIKATGIDKIIKESAVAKVTFYRRFSSKNSLIIEFLEFRHERWMLWFTSSMAEKGNTKEALIRTLEEWFESEVFRGCVFINTVVELGPNFPHVVDISKRHKNEMTSFLRLVLPFSKSNLDDALALSLAIDGAIIRAQFDSSSENALKGLERIVEVLIR